jgi:hypothetical protein
MSTQPTIAQQCEAAMARIRSSINRSAGQHQRAMERQFACSMNAMLGEDSPFCVHGPAGVHLYVTSRASRSAAYVSLNQRKGGAA